MKFYEQSKDRGSKPLLITEAEARKVDDIIKRYLSKHNIYYHTIEGNVCGINDAASIILRHIGKDSEYEIVKK